MSADIDFTISHCRYGEFDGDTCQIAASRDFPRMLYQRQANHPNLIAAFSDKHEVVIGNV